VSKDGISSNWLYSSFSTTFSTPTILFSIHNHKPALHCKVRYIEHLLNIVGEDKRFVFVTKDLEINTNLTIFVLAHSSLPLVTHLHRNMVTFNPT
jgi:hypothetical protein